MANNTEPLSDNEKEELKALKDADKATEGHLTDSQFTRIGELQKKEAEAKQSSAAASKADSGKDTGTAAAKK